MLGRKFYKTKLCVLFQRGRCPRQNCNFAHGDAELRRFGGSFNGRRDYRSGDLRDKLERRHSPQRRYSSGSDVRGYHSFRGQKPISHDRGSSLSRSPTRKSDRRRRKKHMNGDSDASGSLKTSDSAEDRKREDKLSSYDEKDDLEEQLKQMQRDVETLDDKKSQLEIMLEERVEETHKLSSRIEDLESQLNKEQEDCKRITSKIKKFIRAHGRYIKAQEELKRSQARLQRLGDQLGSDISKPGINEEDSSVNIVSDGEHMGNYKTSPRNGGLQNHVTSAKKKRHIYPETSEEAKLVGAGNSRKRERYSDIIPKSERPIRFEGPAAQSENNSKGIEMTKAVFKNKSFTDEYKHRRGKIDSSSFPSYDKVKSSEKGLALPSTGMAAHAVDELIEAIEIDEKLEAVEATTTFGNGAVDTRINSSYMPPLPPPANLNAYKQYEADDEEVDVEKVDSEMVDIDMNCEVEI